MKYITADLKRPVPLGRMGENAATTIRFPINVFFPGFEAATYHLTHTRQGDTEPYPCATEVIDGNIEWVIQRPDVARPGSGVLQLTAIANIDGDIIDKSVILTSHTAPSVGQEGEMPEVYQAWIDTLASYAARAERGAEESEEAAEVAAAAVESAEHIEELAASVAEYAEQAADSAQQGADSAQQAANGAFTAERYMNGAWNAANSASLAAQQALTRMNSADASAQDSEAYAIGKRNGNDVGAGDPAHLNNSKYYMELAAHCMSEAGSSETAATSSMRSARNYANSAQNYAGQATSSASDAATAKGAAETAQAAAEEAAEDAEAYAIGKRGGTDVGSADPAYHNNAKYYAQQASGSASDAATAKGAAETAQGKAEDAQAAAEDAQEAAEAVLASIPSDYTELSADVDDLKSAKAPAIYDTAYGSVANFEDGADGMPLKSLTVNIEPVQAGTGGPSPENVRPITGWTGCNVTRTGKNLFGGSYGAGAKYPLPRGADLVTISAKSTGAHILKLRYYNSEGVRVGTDYNIVNAGETERVVTGHVPDGATQFIMFYSSGGSALDFWDVQFELGYNIDTAYEPYQSTAISVNWQDTAGTVYGGTLDVVNKKLTVTHQAVLLDGTSGLAGFTEGTLANRVQWNGYNAVGVSDAVFVSDKFAAGITGVPNPAYSIFGAAAVPRMYFALPKTFTSLQECKDWFSENNVTVVYPISTPIVYDLADISDVLTLLGANNIWADTGGVSVEYAADTKLYIDAQTKATRKLITGIETSMTASKAYSAGDMLIVGDTLYKVVTAIASGATLTPGTNVNQTTVAEQLLLLANA